MGSALLEHAGTVAPDGRGHLAALRALGLSDAELFTDAGLTDVTAEQNAAWLEGHSAWPWASA